MTLLIYKYETELCMFSYKYETELCMFSSYICKEVASVHITMSVVTQ